MKPEYRDLLDRVACEELDADAPEVLDAARADKGFEASLSELTDLQRQLENERLERDQAFATIPAGDRERDVERTRQALRRAAAGSREPDGRAGTRSPTEPRAAPARSGNRRLAWLYAAALVAAVTLWARPWSRSSRPRPQAGPTLGPEPIQLVMGIEPRSGAWRLEWSGELGPSEKFVVELYAEGVDANAGDRLIDRAEVFGNRWTPSAELPAGTLRGCVVQMAPGGVVVARACVTTSRDDS